MIFTPISIVTGQLPSVGLHGCRSFGAHVAARSAGKLKRALEQPTSQRLSDGFRIWSGLEAEESSAALPGLDSQLHFVNRSFN